MKIFVLEKIELLFLSLYRNALLIILTTALAASLIFLLSGINKSSSKMVEASPAEKAPPPNVLSSAFVSQLTAKNNAVLSENTSKELSQDKKIELDEYEKMANEYLIKLWNHVDSYQKQCAMEKPVDKETFLKNIPQDVMKNLFRTYGSNFALSQDKFLKSVLSDPLVIKMCKESSGQAGVLLRSLDWHKDEWSKQIAAGIKFDLEEEERISKFKLSEMERVENLKLESKHNYMLSLYAFGIFMSLMLLLIFYRIEINLRHLRNS